ncbi:hypothetical protein WH240_04795 [Gluconobacter wancherniae]|uniref:hypothetical protein n=1 Tax=Gluconobacter wancherniae TaxID=1307955 RepID=UPI0030AAB058
MSTFCKAEVSGLTFSCGGMNQPKLCHGVDSGERERSASYARADGFHGNAGSVSLETLRKWMRGDGIWLTRSLRRSFHQSRIRRERFGELVQIDGSEHR